MLEDYPDVFADIMNVFLFHGEQVVREEELQETDVLSQYKADTTRLHQQERDILKLWVRKDKTVYLGVENQTASDADMPSADHQLRWGILSKTAAEGFWETGE